MPATFHDILDQLEAASLNSAEKGRRFEELMVSYLKTDPAYAEMYDEVWLWNDYPDRGKRTDTGIDLVALDKQGEKTAIQCKFFAPTTTVSKPMLDSFLAASSRAEFTNRLIISTSDKWGKNAEEAIEDQYPPVARLRALDLSASPIDWTEFSIESPEEMEKLPPKTPRPYQREAIDDVLSGFEKADRGKLIMACGAGKTYTSLKLAEEMVPEGGSVLFLVPSISLLSQTVREWTAECERPLRSFAVCSDVKVGKRKKSESEDISVTDLAFPASTDGEQLAQKFHEIEVEDKGFTAVFSTYQSIGAIGDAQNSKWGGGIPEFDLIICDEAHRTTGVTLEDKEESAFVRVHSNSFVEGKKRLYMTATPRVYGEAAQSKAIDAGAILADMNDPTYYGEEFHRLSFATAVEREILTDYKVLILAVDEGHISRQFQGLLASAENELGLEDAAKLVGCWNGLAKRTNAENLDEFESDPEPMRRAVAFAGNIKNSKRVEASFKEVVENEGDGLAPEGEADLNVHVRHVDGTQNVLVRNEALDWLREDPGEGQCRILSNAKCLSEGVDVPALDAVLFLAPRKSQVDVVQSVGRVMRKPKDGSKKFGYVILPIAVAADADPEQALNDNERYKVVWQVLQALRSHDERLDATINKIDLTGDTGPISFTAIGGGDDEDPKDTKEEGTKQLAMAFPHLDEWRDSIFARIVKKVGDRQYWDTWAKDIAKIAEQYTTRIKALVEAGDTEISAAFDEFLRGLQDNLNPQVDQGQAVEMLAQHLITRPVFDALFEDYSFSESNPVSVSMQKMLDLLELQRLDKEQTELDSFYRSVRMRAAGIKDPAAKQGIVKDLYETFFRSAFKDMADRLGIVYTPVEIVDFILNSADEALREHFGKGITDEGVHVLDPFTGTGTFIVRLIQSGLINPGDLERKFRYELHANEIVLLAYYVAAINIEEAYHGEAGGEYQSFEGIVLTDTFQMHEEDDQDELPGMESFPENNERVKRQKEQEIRVIVGNPPYSVGQTSGNDDNQNLGYETLDERTRNTYGAKSDVPARTILKDSYVRAFRWASDRIGEKGIICFVSNGGFLDANTAAGVRRSFFDEFSQISVFNLRGNQRTAGEQSRREGGKVFGGGSRATIAVTLLVKDPEADVQCKLLYRDIGDYLSREQKLAEIGKAGSFAGLGPEEIVPNEEGDWLNQRDPAFQGFPAIGSNKSSDRKQARVFRSYSAGVKTNRDPWVWGFSETKTRRNVERISEVFNAELQRKSALERTGEAFERNNDPMAISWSVGLRGRLEKGLAVEIEGANLVRGTYRPFTRQHVYFDSALNEARSKLPESFPEPDSEDFGIYLTSPSTHFPTFETLMVDCVPDLHTLDTGQFFPRYTYVKHEDADTLLDAAGGDGSPYRRIDNITDEILAEYKWSFGGEVSKDDIFFYVYGLLHSPDYRDRYQADLKKMLPRIPKVEAFREFSEAGRKLSEIHLGYESIDPFPLNIEESVDPDYRVQKMKFGGKGKNKDRSTIIYNDQITVAGIPEEAYRYMLGSRSAVEWIIDRYQVKTDKKSGITNDPNDWAKEVGDPRYILALLCRIVTVSTETMKIVDGLPSLKVVEEGEVD